MKQNIAFLELNKTLHLRHIPIKKKMSNYKC